MQQVDRQVKINDEKLEKELYNKRFVVDVRNSASDEIEQRITKKM